MLLAQGVGMLMRVDRVTEHFLEATLEAKKTKSRVVLNTCIGDRDELDQEAAGIWQFTLVVLAVWECSKVCWQKLMRT